MNNRLGSVDWVSLNEYQGIVSLGEEEKHPLVCNVHLASPSDQDPALFPSMLQSMEDSVEPLEDLQPSLIKDGQDEYNRCRRRNEVLHFQLDLVHFHGSFTSTRGTDRENS